MYDRVVCPECGGWVETTDGIHWYCDTCDYEINDAD